MRKVCFLTCLYALISGGFTSIGHASPTPADSVHFCLPVDVEEMQARDSIYAASKQALNLNVGLPRTVRMIYFLPNDRQFRTSVVDSMKRAIRRIQTFYGEQMQAHGYGNRTFDIETDAQGEPIVHRVDGQHPDSHYRNDTFSPVFDEFRQAFDVGANIYLIVVDNNTNAIVSGGASVGGTGDRWGKSGGFVMVSVEFGFKTAAHTLGYAFGLNRDFSAGANIMSFGPGQNRLSACNAHFLAVHPYFNTEIPIEEDEGEIGPTRELLSPQEFPAEAGSAPVRIRVADPVGLHQVLLFATTHEPHPAAGFREIKACRALEGEQDAVVEFDYDGVIPSDGGTSLSNPARHEMHVQAVDTEGNVGHMRFDLLPLPPNRIATLVHGREGSFPDVESVAFAPNGDILASGSAQGTVKLWNVSTRTNIRTLEHGSRVESVAFSPDGNIVASHSHEVTLWDSATGKKMATLFRTYGGGSVAFSPDGAILAAGSPDNKVRLWEVSTRRQIATLLHGQIGPSLHTVAFSPDGKILASGSQDGKIKLWSVANYREIATLDAHSESVFSVAFSPVGNLLASAGITQDPTDRYSKDSTVKLWDVKTKRKIATIEVDTNPGYSYWVRSVAFSPDGTILATGSWDNTVKLWDVETGSEVASFGHSNHSGCIGRVHSVTFSPNGSIIASAVHVGNCGGPSGASRPWRGEIHLWEVSEYTSVPPSSGSNADAVLSLDLIPDGGVGNKINDGVTSGTVSGKDTKIAVEVFGSGVKTSLAGLLVKFDFDSSLLAFVKAESGGFGFSIPQATGAYFAATENVNLQASGFLARGEFNTVVDVTNREFSIGIDVVTLAESQTLSNDIKTTKVISFNSTPLPATFSVSLDGDSAAGDQRVDTLNVSAGSTVPIQVFARDIRGANGISTRFEYAEAQLTYQGFDAGSLLPSAQVLPQHHTNPTAVEISVVSFGGQAAADSGLVGTARFSTTDMLSATTLHLVSAEIGRGDQRESLTLSDTAVILRLAQLTPDFNGDGRVDFGDFVALGMHFGASRGDARYDAKYDLDQDGTIGFGDFLIFGQEFGSGA